MDFEKIEQAYTYLLENVQVIQSDLATNFYDALVEQNSIYLDGETELEQVKDNNQTLKRLALRKEEWLKTYQFLLMKAGQTEPLQANHQFTPDAIALLLVFIVEELFKEEEITILEMGSGMGILGATFLTSLTKKVDYLGMEVDDLLIDLAASMADVIGLQAGFVQGDAVASRHQVASSQEHTYAHHLLMEQGLKYLKSDGYAIFLAPSDLLTSPQSNLLKVWLKEEASLVAMISLPENLFANAKQSKTIFILQKKSEIAVEPFVYPLASLQDASVLMKFKENFQKWTQGTEI
ncbi:adenine-specific methyltransferase [Streptococcus pneumoniae]|nr:adenine-specific methyltransferase [Streptococcus pneumoniae]